MFCLKEHSSISCGGGKAYQRQTVGWGGLAIDSLLPALRGDKFLVCKTIAVPGGFRPCCNGKEETLPIWQHCEALSTWTVQACHDSLDSLSKDPPDLPALGEYLGGTQ